MFNFVRSILISVAVLVSFYSSQALAASVAYTIEALPDTPVAINDSGQVLLTDGIWENGVVTPIDFASLTNAPNQVVVKDINDAGQVTGRYVPIGDYQGQAFIWDQGIVTDLSGYASGHSSRAGGGLSISNTGVVAGWIDIYPGAPYHAAFWSNAVESDLGETPSNIGSIAINDNGIALYNLGTRDNWDSYQELVDTNTGQISTLPLLNGSRIRYADINNNNTVVGSIDDGTGRHIYVSNDGVLTDMGTFPSGWRTWSRFPVAINDTGAIVGGPLSGPGGPSAQAFLLAGGVIHDLDELLPEASGWVHLQYAADINNTGQIVGVGVKDGVVQGYILSPAGI